MEVKIDISYKTAYRRVQYSRDALDVPRIDLKSPVEIDEFSLKAGLKICERDGWLRSRGLSTCGVSTFAENKPPVFVLVDCGSSERYVIPVKAATELRIRLLLADCR